MGKRAYYALAVLLAVMYIIVSMNGYELICMYILYFPAAWVIYKLAT